MPLVWPARRQAELVDTMVKCGTDVNISADRTDAAQIVSAAFSGLPLVARPSGCAGRYRRLRLQHATSITLSTPGGPFGLLLGSTLPCLDSRSG